jgi:acyl carrier protein
VSGDPSLVNGGRLDDLITEIVAEVLVIPSDAIHPGASLIRDLGAESIDFMDLVFRLEDALGRSIPYTRWQRFLEVNLAGSDLSVAITPEVVRAFAEEEIARA